MASPLATFIIFMGLSMCSLHTVVMANKPPLHIGFYTNEYRAPPNATVLLAAGTAQGGNFSQVAWGSLVVFDNIVKENENTDSATLGRITGWVVSTTRGGPRDGGVQMVAALSFGPASQYNGSMITVLPGGVLIGAQGDFQGYHGYGSSLDVTPVMTDPLHIYKWDIYLFKY